MSEFVQIVVDFSKLEKINMGGVKGHTLTNSVRDISLEFQNAVSDFKGAPFDILDLKTDLFDSHFFKFKSVVKLLEPRLCFVIASAIDDSPLSSLKVIDLFESLVERPSIKDGLEQKYMGIIRAAIADIGVVTDLFYKNSSKPPIFTNLPPIAGSLKWIRGLYDRIRTVHESIGRLDSLFPVLGSERVSKYNFAVQLFEKFRAEKLAEWHDDAAKSAKDKLNSTIMRREGNKLYTNFDADLVCLLREVKYFLSLKLSVHDESLSIYRQEETFRNQSTNLDMITGMYNEMITGLSPVEFPLLESEMKALDVLFEPACTSLYWTSPISDFISNALERVKSVYAVVKGMKSNLKELEKIMKTCISKPLIGRKLKPVTTKEFQESQLKLITARKKEIQEDSDNYSRILSDTMKLVKVDSSSPLWLNYVDYVQNLIVEGLSTVVSNNISSLIEMCSLESSALITVNLSLAGREVVFLPEDEAPGKDPMPGTGGLVSARASFRSSFSNKEGSKTVNTDPLDVWNFVYGVIDSFLNAISVVKRIDGKMVPTKVLFFLLFLSNSVQ